MIKEAIRVRVLAWADGILGKMVYHGELQKGCLHTDPSSAGTKMRMQQRADRSSLKRQLAVPDSLEEMPWLTLVCCHKDNEPLLHHR